MRGWLIAALFLSCVRAPPDFASVMRRHVAADGPNAQHMQRLAEAAPAFARTEGALLDVVLPAVLLHDAAKEHGDGTPYERFCTHHQQSAVIARRELTALGLEPAIVERVAQAIEQHMGPLGDNAEFAAPRFMTGFCKRDFPTPTTIEARVVFDLDMLDLMTVAGVVKVVTLRQKNAEFARESVKDSALTGKDSAWKSVIDARHVLMTATGQRCGETIQRHTRAFLDSVDFEAVTSVETFSAAAAAWLTTHPQPHCVSP